MDFPNTLGTEDTGNVRGGPLKRYLILLFAGILPVFCQSNSGELRIHVADPSGRGVQATVHLLSQANQYASDLETDTQGNLAIARLPYGIYRLNIDQSGFEPVVETLAIRSSIPVTHPISLKLATLEQTVAVQTANTLIDPEQPGNVDQLGSSFIQHLFSTVLAPFLVGLCRIWSIPSPAGSMKETLYCTHAGRNIRHSSW